jgi:hypothetical protein
MALQGGVLKNFGLFSYLLFVLSSIAIAQLSSAPQNSDFRQTSSTLAAEQLPVTLIAQGGNGGWNQMMAAKCREWEQSKNAPASAAWTCINGRPATQQETNEAIRRLHQQGEQNARKMVEQQRQQQTEIQKIINKYSGGTEPQNRAVIVNPDHRVVPHINQPSTLELSLPAGWNFAHPHPDMLMAIDVAALGKSTTLQEMLTRLPEPVQVSAKNFGSQLRQLGEVEQAWLSIRSGDFLGLLQGRLNFPHGFVQLANGMASYRISRTAVVFGRPASVAEAVQRLSRAAPSSLISRRMKALSVGNEISLSGTRTLLTTQSAMPMSNSNDLSGFSFGLALRDELKLQLRLNSDTAAGARRLLATVRKAATLSDSSISANATLEGTSVRLTLAIQRAYLLHTLDKALFSPMGQRLTAMASAPSMSKVVVQGLPGGPKELQTSGQMVPAPDSSKAPFGKIVVQGMPEGTKVIASPH